MIQEGTRLTLDDLEARVRRGARYMDITDPNWYVPGNLIPDRFEDHAPIEGYYLEDGKGIDLTQFDLSNCERCVLGQRMASYSEAIDSWTESFAATLVGQRYGFFQLETKFTIPRAQRLGFDLPERETVWPGQDPNGLHAATFVGAELYLIMGVLWEYEIESRRKATVQR